MTYNDYRNDRKWWSRSYKVYDASAHLKKMALALGDKLGVKVVINEHSDETPHANITNKVVQLGIRDAWRHGDDYLIGILLHEIGHIKFSPPKEEANGAIKHLEPEKYANEMLNILEDCRVEHAMKGVYAGAASFLQATAEGVLVPVAEFFLKNKNPVIDGKDKRYHRVIAQAFILYDKIAEYKDIKSSDEAVNTASLAIAKLMTESESCANVYQLTAKALEIIKPFIPREEPEPELEQSRVLFKVLKHMTSDGGYRVVQRVTEYESACKTAEPAIAQLRRRLTFQLRANDRTRFSGVLSKGTLNKKTLHKTKRNNFKVYHKRILPRSQKYALMTVLDTSGSMWMGDINAKPRIDFAMQATALLTKGFRSLGHKAGIVNFGGRAITSLSLSDRYVVDNVQKVMTGTDGNEDYDTYYYHANNNVVSTAIPHALKELAKAGRAYQKILFVITDGGLEDYDVIKSRAQLRMAITQGIEPIVLYVDSLQVLLHDPSREIMIQNSNLDALIGEATKLLHRITPIEASD